MDDWLKVLTRCCSEHGQATIAKRIGYSPAVVSVVLKGDYKGSLAAVEAAVRGRLMSERVDCPVFFEAINRGDCARNQRIKPAMADDPVSRALRSTCPACVNRIGGAASC